MKIAIVRTSSTVLSAATYNIQEIGLARALVPCGHACDVYLAGATSAHAVRSVESIEGACAREIRLPALALPGRQGLFPGLRGRLARGGYDLIQVHEDSQVESVRISSWARKRRIPVVLCQGMYANYEGPVNVALQRLYDRTLLPLLRRNTRAVSAKSSVAADYCVRKGFRDVVVNPVGLAVEAFAEPVEIDWRGRLGLAKGAAIVLYVGVHEPRRRTDVLVDAVALLAGRRRDVALVLVGGGPTRERTRASARAVLGDRVRCIDRVTQAELPSLYRSAAVTALPTTFEIYGMTALESMYFGTPVIASGVGGLRELVGGDSGGALVESFDPAEWESVIDAVLSRSDDERRNAQDAARRKAAGLEWSSLSARYAAFYERVVGNEDPQR